MKPVNCLVFVLCLVAFARPERLSTAGCAAPDQNSANALTYYAGIASSADSLDAAFRSKYALSLTPAEQVVLVSDSVECAAATAAYTREAQDSSTARTVHVVKVGDRRIVIDPSYMIGEWSVAMVFDSTYVTLLNKHGF